MLGKILKREEHADKERRVRKEEHRGEGKTDAKL